MDGGHASSEDDGAQQPSPRMGDPGPAEATPAIPLRIRQLVTPDLTHRYRAEDEWKRLIDGLRGPIPRRGG